MAGLAALDTDLIRAAGDKTEPDDAEVFPPAEHVVTGHRQFRGTAPLIGPRVTDMAFQLAACRGEPAVNKGQVYFFYAALAELVHEALLNELIFGKKYQTRGFFIDTMTGIRPQG
jgi:hypothetical protein